MDLQDQLKKLFPDHEVPVSDNNSVNLSAEDAMPLRRICRYKMPLQWSCNLEVLLHYSLLLAESVATEQQLAVDAILALYSDGCR